MGKVAVDCEELEAKVFELIIEAKRCGVGDRTLAYILLRNGINCFLRQIAQEELDGNKR